MALIITGVKHKHFSVWSLFGNSFTLTLHNYKALMIL